MLHVYVWNLEYVEHKVVSVVVDVLCPKSNLKREMSQVWTND